MDRVLNVLEQVPWKPPRAVHLHPSGPVAHVEISVKLLLEVRGFRPAVEKPAAEL
jgi:hypothetical protein